MRARMHNALLPALGLRARRLPVSPLKGLLRLFAATLLLLCSTLPAQAHKSSDAYLAVKVQGGQLEVQWDIALRDLEAAIGLDADGNGEITWGELRAQHAAIAAYAQSRLSMSAGEAPCPLQVREHLVDRHSDGAYAVLRLAGPCGNASVVPASLKLRYGLLFDLDPQHRGLVRIVAGELTQTAIFSPENPQQEIRLSPQPPLETFLQYAREGVWHIWIGIDHILFLVSLLLPCVLVLRLKQGPNGAPDMDGARAWQPVDRPTAAFWDVLRVVTAFTLAHSITLSAAVLGWISLPSRLVESVIAASVVMAAMNNVSPIVEGRRWLVAFVFGLIHGFGFASVLADLGLPGDALVLALLGFNLGVELGQLAIVVVFLPVALALRGTAFYRRWVLTGGSLLIALVAAVWFAERAFDLKLIS